MSSHVVVNSFPITARIHPDVGHAKDILARDKDRAAKFLKSVQPHGPLFVQECLARRHHGHHGEQPAPTTGGTHCIDVTNAAVTYTMPCEIGADGQKFNLLIDTGSSNTWVGAATKFVPSTSTEDTRNQVEVGYGSGHFKGTECIDTVKLGKDLVIERQSIGVASTCEGFSGNDVDGILGIGPCDLTTGTVKNTSSVPTVTDNLLKQGTITVESIGCYYAPTNGSDMGRGEIAFGGTDRSKISGEMIYVPITKTSPASKYWGVDQEICYGSKIIMNKTAGIVDTGTTLILLPSDTCKAYQEATGAVMDSHTGLYCVTPEQFEKMESLNFRVGDTTCELTKNAQIWPRSMNKMLGGEESKIYLICTDIGSIGGNGLDFIDGYCFLQRFYTEYDSSNARVGFAQTLYTNDVSN